MARLQFRRGKGLSLRILSRIEEREAFGQTTSDGSALDEILCPQAMALSAALAQVRGCRQMTIGLFGSTAAGHRLESPSGDASSSSGRSYLKPRYEADGQFASPLTALRSRYIDIIQAGRRTYHPDTPALLSIDRLVHTAMCNRYWAVMQAAPRDVRFAVSGPWPPYAFGRIALSRRSVGQPREIEELHR